MEAKGIRPMRRLLMTLSLASLIFGVGACASLNGSGDSGPSAGGTEYPAGYSAPPPGSPLSKVHLDMNDTEVRNIMGEPDNSNAYMTGKSWIPFYYGPDTTRTDWMYGGIGRVVFSRNRYTGGLKVIKVLYNPNEK